MGFFDKFEAKELNVSTKKVSVKATPRERMVEGLKAQIKYAEYVNKFKTYKDGVEKYLEENDAKRSPFWFTFANGQYGTTLKFGTSFISPWTKIKAGTPVDVGTDISHLIEFYKDSIEAVERGELDDIINTIANKPRKPRTPKVKDTEGQGELEAAPEATKPVDDQPVIEVQDEIIPHQTVSSRRSHKK